MSKAINPSNLAPAILLCQHRSCRKAGSAKVLKAFKELSPQGISVIACGCLGRCGSGPNAIVMPEEIEYSHLKPTTVVDIVQRHWGRAQRMDKPLKRQGNFSLEIGDE